MSKKTAINGQQLDDIGLGRKHVRCERNRFSPRSIVFVDVQKRFARFIQI